MTIVFIGNTYGIHLFVIVFVSSLSVRQITMLHATASKEKCREYRVIASSLCVLNEC